MRFPFFKVQGIIVLVISVICAFLVKNLFIKFLSNALIFFLIYFYLIQWYQFIKNTGRKPVFSDMNYQSLFPFKENRIRFKIENLILFFPGFYFKVKIDIFENNNRILKKTYSLEDFEDQQVTLPFVFDRHGLFKINDFELLILDVFGFTVQKIKLDINQVLNVYPYYLEPVQSEINLKEGGDQVIQAVARINSTDFFENRKYYPGDDLRKLNWKIFAHSKELHIREVEKIPPKVGKLNLLFAPYSENYTEYELASSLFYSCCMNYINNQLNITVYSPASRTGTEFNSDNKHQLMDLIMNSYFPYSFGPVMGEYELFLSFDELKKGTEAGVFKNSYGTVVFHSPQSGKKKINMIYKIHEYDSLLSEVYHFINMKKKSEFREELLKKYREICGQSNVKLAVYRVNYESFKTE